MDPKAAKAYLQAICDDLDHGRAPKRRRLARRLRKAVGPAALGLSLGLSGCGDLEPVPLYAAPAEECADQRDNDGDGKVDCADSECASASECGAVALYSVPVERETACTDGADNDSDGVADCMDADCNGKTECQVVALYSAPVEVAETACADGLDGDGDGLTDCADSDCRGTDGC